MDPFTYVFFSIIGLVLGGVTVFLCYSCYKYPEGPMD